MEYRKYQNVYVVRLDRGELVVDKLQELVQKEHISLAKIEGLGAADFLKAGLYDVETREFKCKEFHEPLEILSLIGNVTVMDGKPYFHIHIAVSDEQQRAWGGHLKEARIGGTGEIFLTVLDGTVGRMQDRIGNTGLNIFSFS